MNEQVNAKFSAYRERHLPVCVIVNGESQHLLQLKAPLCFADHVDDLLVRNTQDGDYALLLEEWSVSPDEYDDIVTFASSNKLVNSSAE